MCTAHLWRASQETSSLNSHTREHAMKKTILITGATAGIGKLTAERLVAAGHRVLVHGRSAGKLDALTAALSAQAGTEIKGFRADLSDMAQVEALAAAVTAHTPTIDVLLNNAGVFRTPQTRTAAGLDIRFAVNTLAPYLPVSYTHLRAHET